LRSDIVELLRPPSTRTAHPEPLIEVAPLDYGYRALSAALAGALDVSFEIAIEPGGYAYSVTGKTQPQMGLQKRREMQGLKAAKEMNVPPPLSRGLCGNL
jgi:hypothetical protein